MSEEIKTEAEKVEEKIVDAIVSDDEDAAVSSKTDLISLIFIKLLSGRFILTVSSAVCFAFITKTVCDVLAAKSEGLTVTEITSILSSVLIVVSNVFTFYFVRKAMNNESGTGK